MAKIKELRRMLGVLTLGVIGRITPWNDGKTIIETGKGVASGGWEKNGHIVLTPGEREELITVLESHREVPRIEVGDVIGGPVAAEVMAIEYHGGGSGESTGTVLAYSPHKREYWVWSVGPTGELKNGAHTFDSGEALNRYAARATERLFTFLNRAAPALTFSRVPDGSRLKV